MHEAASRRVCRALYQQSNTARNATAAARAAPQHQAKQQQQKQQQPMFSVDNVDRFKPGESNEILGPGTYNPGEYHAIKKAPPTPNGFGHTQRVFSGNSGLLDGPVVDRQPHGDRLKGPGPLAYTVQDDRMISPVRRQSVSGPMQSQSRGRQDAHPREITPGPGAYLRMNRDIKRKSVPPPPPPAVSWERVPTAPSIPGHHQSFGYEESPMGELVQQVRVDEGYDGTKMSMPGPSDYRPSMRGVKPNRGHVDLARTSGHDTFDRKQEAPVPFNPYDHPHGTHPVRDFVEETPGTRDGKPRKSAAFASGVGRSSIDGDLGQGLLKPSPGPGSYDLFGRLASPRENRHVLRVGRSLKDGPGPRRETDAGPICGRCVGVRPANAKTFKAPRTQ